MHEAEYKEIFFEESAAQLEELESALLALEDEPGNLKLVGQIFRVMHTIKGSGAMFGFEEIAAFAHHVETVLGRVRDGLLPVDKEIINLVLASRDHIAQLIAAAKEERILGPEAELALVARLLACLTPGPATEAPSPPPAAAPITSPPGAPGRVEEPARPKRHYQIHFQPSLAFFAEGGQVEPILAELSKLGTLTITARGAERAGAELPPWELNLASSAEANTLRDLFIFAENTCRYEITSIAGEAPLSPPPSAPAAVPISAPAAVPTSAPPSAPATPPARPPQAAKEGDFIRVSAAKLDELMNLVGELVVTQARLSQISASQQLPVFQEPVENVQRLTGELRDCALQMRMLPIGTTFARFKRLVRDLAGELGKEVVLLTEGEETELDKSMIAQLGDPLIHLIRNSLDHGLELPEVRSAAGKNRQGTITLSARHQGGQVTITVADDGRGLDAGAIRAKAVARGIIKPEASLSEGAIHNLIFEAGLSTAAAITSVSGRGVGMDVVKSTVEGALRGTVAIFSEMGAGSRVEISLPLTLAIIDGLLIQAGPNYFVLPQAQVQECVELSAAILAEFPGRQLLPVRGELVPYIVLRDFFALPGERPGGERVVIVESDGERTGLVLDRVVGGYQTVIKSLGPLYREAEGLAGATILGNGEIALIIDIPKVVHLAKSPPAANFLKKV